MEKYVVSQELAHKLKAAKFPQNTQWAYDMDDSEDGGYILVENPGEHVLLSAAPLSDELLEQLPRFVGEDYWPFVLIITQDNPRKWCAGYTDEDDVMRGGQIQPSSRLADDLAELWLWCKENGHLPTPVGGDQEREDG